MKVKCDHTIRPSIYGFLLMFNGDIIWHNSDHLGNIMLKYLCGLD